jgi:hypothetical protein
MFLVHVYYHEVSDLFAPASATPFTVARTSASDLRRWLRLLIRNEGVGNYVVLDDLLEFRRGPARLRLQVLRNVFGADAEAFFELYAASSSNDVHPLSDAIIREAPTTQHY